MPRPTNLRPVFYRLPASHIEAGWISTETGSIWGFIAEAIKPLPEARPALLIGERVQFHGEIDVWPEGFVEPGDRGVVVRRHRTTGAVEVFIEQSGLLLALTPHSTENATLACVKPFWDSFTHGPLTA